MYNFEEDLFNSILGLDESSVEDQVALDPDDEFAMVEAALDIEIAEACKKEACKKESCKKEACKKEGKGVCEKCGKPIEQCECTKTESTDDMDEYDDELDDYGVDD